MREGEKQSRRRAARRKPAVERRRAARRKPAVDALPRRAYAAPLAPPISSQPLRQRVRGLAYSATGRRSRRRFDELDLLFARFTRDPRARRATHHRPAEDCPYGDNGSPAKLHDPPRRLAGWFVQRRPSPVTVNIPQCLTKQQAACQPAQTGAGRGNIVSTSLKLECCVKRTCRGSLTGTSCALPRVSAAVHLVQQRGREGDGKMKPPALEGTARVGIGECRGGRPRREGEPRAARSVQGRSGGQPTPRTGSSLRQVARARSRESNGPGPLPHSSGSGPEPFPFQPRLDFIGRSGRRIV